MSIGLIFDIAAAIVLAVCLFRGLIRGFFGELLGLIGFCASLFCGWTFAQPGAELILKYFPALDRTFVALACGVILFLAVSVAFALAGGLLSSIVRAANLSALDHLCGAALGAVKTAGIVVIIYGVLTVFSPSLPSGWMEESYALRGAAVVWPSVARFLQEHEMLNLKDFTEADLEGFVR